MVIPRVETRLPELMEFTLQLAGQYEQGTLNHWQTFSDQVRAFFTPDMMERVERLVPGWGQMASYADQATLIHVTSVLTALYLLPEYRQAGAEERALMVWMVLFHDVAKVARPGQHDPIHGFRSAAVAGKALGQVGFPVTDDYANKVDHWVALTHDAVVYHPEHQEMIPDNRHLPQIISGIDDLYGPQAPSGAAVKGILFHISIVTDPDYPILAPLTEDEMRDYIDTAGFQMLKAMILVDNDGWNLFDRDLKARQRQKTLAAFDQLEALIGAGR